MATSLLKTVISNRHTGYDIHALCILRATTAQAYGMFVYSEETRTYWIAATSIEAEGEFCLVGQLMGLAIYNAVLIEAHFPHALYAKLLGKRPAFEARPPALLSPTYARCCSGHDEDTIKKANKCALHGGSPVTVMGSHPCACLCAQQERRVAAVSIVLQSDCLGSCAGPEAGHAQARAGAAAAAGL